MNSITINFDDALFRETGIRTNSVSLREASLTIGDAPYTLRATKQNVAGEETLYLGLYDPSDAPVADLRVHHAGHIFQVDTAVHPESVIVPLPSGMHGTDLSIDAASLDMHIAVSIQLEGHIPHSAADEQPASDVVLNLLNTVGRTLKTSPRSVSGCPEPELIMAYSYGELSADNTKRVADHVHRCLDCLDMVLTARAAREAVENAPLPAWLNTTAPAAPSEPLSLSDAGKVPWRYPSVKDFIREVQKRWDRVLEWPLAAMEFLDPESVLLSASFRLEALPLRAADDPEQTITAQWVLLDDGNITDIRPLHVRIHHQEITNHRIELSGELPSEVVQSPITLLFGWMPAEGELLELTVTAGEIRNGFFSRTLTTAKRIDPNGKLKMLVIGAWF